MAKLATLLAVAALLVASAAAHDFATEDGVLVLTDATFDDAISQLNPLLVEFYAPWCGHCKRLTPEYAAAAQDLAKRDPPLYIAKVDATAEKEVANRFQIRGFPTLKFFRNGEATEYGGGRTQAEIVNWVVKKSGPAASTASSLDEIKAAVDTNEVVALGFFASAESAEAQAFVAAAGGNDDVPFVMTFSEEAAAEYKVTVPAVVVMQSFDDGRVDFSGEFTAEAIGTFVAGNSLPSVIEFTQQSAGKIFGGPVKIHVLLFTDPAASYHEEFLSNARAVSQSFKGRALFIWVGPAEGRVMDYFGIKSSDMPTTVLVTMFEDSPMKKFMSPAPGITIEKLNDFVGAYFDGKLKPFLKSEEPPATQEAVKVIVGKTFSEIVLDESKDVLVEFYAPWCGHCKALAPKYDELAEKLSGVPSIVIAKMDSTANEVDHPGVNIRGFPTILFFPAGDKSKVVDYNGEREVQGFIDFLKTNAATPFTLEADGEL